MKRTAMAALLGLVSWSVQAGHDVPGWRVGVAAAFNDFEWTDGESELIKDGSVGLKFHAQYQINDWLGIEGAYHNTGDFEEDSTDPAATGDLNLGFDGFSAALVGYVPTPSEEIKVYFKAGMFDFDDELSLNGSEISNGKEDGLMAGGGTTIEVADHWGIRADFDWFDADVGDLWAVNIGLEYFFGGSSRKSGGSSAPQAPAPAPQAEAAPAEPETAVEPAPAAESEESDGGE